MAFHVSFDGPTLVITVFGTMDAADLEGMIDNVLTVEKGGANTPHRLIDLRQVTDVAVGYQEMARLADIARTRPLNAMIRSCLLVRQPVQLGYARMFQILNDHPQVTVRIFDDEVTARAWLTTGGNDPADVETM